MLKASEGSLDGLSTEAARLRRAQHGYNELQSKRIEPWYLILLQQFANTLVYMLIGAAALLRLSVPRAKARRDGAAISLDARELVPGVMAKRRTIALATKQGAFQ
jgi:hypothetical protein